MLREYSNHNKRWSIEEYNILDNNIKNLKKINSIEIEKIAKTLKRTYDSIKYKILSLYIEKEYDYLNNNDKIYKKYVFLEKEEIDNHILNRFTKKEKKNYYLMRISIIINNSKIKEKEKVNKLIDNITKLL